jgi:hypothetical protein
MRPAITICLGHRPSASELRLWMLGGEELPLWVSEKHKGRFESQIEYKRMRESVFSVAAEIMDDTGTVSVRTDTRDITRTTTLETLFKLTCAGSDDLRDVLFSLSRCCLIGVFQL